MTVRAEIQKLRRLPVAWIAATGGLLLAGFLFVIFLLKSDVASETSGDPWHGFFGLAITVFGMLIVPFVILITNALVQVEHQSETWKFLYSLPVSRGRIYVAKLGVSVGLIGLIFVVFALSIVGAGFLLSWAAPAYGFANYRPDLWLLVNRLFHLLVAALGVAALQFWLSLRWRHYLIPLAVGFIGYIVSMFTVGKSDAALFVPYCYPVFISLGLGGGDMGRIGLEWWGALANVEWFSILAFFGFGAIGAIDELTKEIRE